MPVRVTKARQDKKLFIARRLTMLADACDRVQLAAEAQFHKTMEYPNHWTAPFTGRRSDELALLGRRDLLEPETWHG
jgi:hypothetical protein